MLNSTVAYSASLDSTHFKLPDVVYLYSNVCTIIQIFFCPMQVLFLIAKTEPKKETGWKCLNREGISVPVMLQQIAPYNIFHTGYITLCIRPTIAIFQWQPRVPGEKCHWISTLTDWPMVYFSPGSWEVSSCSGQDFSFVCPGWTSHLVSSLRVRPSATHSIR